MNQAVSLDIQAGWLHCTAYVVNNKMNSVRGSMTRSCFQGCR